MEKLPSRRIKLSPLCNRLKLIVETVLDWLGEKWLDKLAKNSMVKIKNIWGKFRIRRN